jgi:hypothetical protein
MKQIEREMKGNDANATDDEVCTYSVYHNAQTNVCRTTSCHLHIQMSLTMMLKIALAPSLPRVAEHTLKLIGSSKTMRDGKGSLKPELHLLKRTKMRMTRLKNPQADLPDLLARTATKQLLTTT